MSNPKKITVNFKSAAQLAEYYLPFFKDGGFFFTTDYAFKLHDEIVLKLTLPDGDQTPIEVNGTIAFINPRAKEEILQICDIQGSGVALTTPPSYLMTRINALLRMHNATQTTAS
ncbi:hypothetical protein MMG00_13010 [Ignatzschineria rhizosphaerae]|uniref:PilZ domain-containing protein n=1 Tax=Ignatzschineria rhizosphaerae TaxID=2923279 RepID=A0ABY3WZM9_9GAMM|nr:hypothetical protein [Ignatzschineria rhizosphaerae]UNM96099.1 hypothetical protein MMG00_13010 [Ignatzschineria rhizosphaerae]